MGQTQRDRAAAPGAHTGSIPTLRRVCHGSERWGGGGRDAGCKGRSLVLSNRPGERPRGEQRRRRSERGLESWQGKASGAAAGSQQEAAGTGRVEVGPGRPRLMRRASGWTSGGRAGWGGRREESWPLRLCEPPREEGPLGGGTGTATTLGKKLKAEEAGTAVCAHGGGTGAPGPWNDRSRCGRGKGDSGGQRRGASGCEGGSQDPCRASPPPLSQSHCH